MAARLATVAVASALFMEFIDSTALSTALPTLAKAFHTDPVHLKLALTSYILALAVGAPASGWVADRFGPRRVFMAAMAAFLAGSVLCGFSHSLAQLVGFRIVQGMGGAMMTPVGRQIVVGLAPRDRLVAAMSWFTMPALVGPLLGPPLAGILLGFADWTWIFFINVPVGLVGMIAVGRLVPRLRQPDPGRFDTRGYLMAALAITSIVAVAETAGAGLIPPLWQAVGVAVAVAASGAYVVHAMRTDKPVLNLRLLRYATYRASVTGGSLVRLGLGATPFLMPLLLQIGLGWSPLQAGLVTIWTALGAMVSKPVVARLIRRVGFRTTLVVSNLFGAILTAAPAFFRANTSIPLILVILAMGGFVRSLQFTAVNTVAYADVPPETVGAASTLSTVAQQIGLALGISLGGLLLHLTVGHGGALTPDRFVLPFLAIGAVSLMAGPVYHRLSPNAGAHISGQR